MAMMNSAGDMGSPCLTPLPNMNGSPKTPLRRIEVDAVCNNPQIQEIHLSPKPLLRRTSSKNSQERVSKP